MTPGEAATLQNIGEGIRETFAAIIFKSLIFPLYAFSVFKACAILSRKRFTVILLMNFAIILVLFLCALVLLVIDISSFIQQLNITLIHNSNVPIDERLAAANNASFKLASVEDALYAYMTILGDAVIIWRVHILWNYGGRRRWLVLLWSLLLGSLVTDVLLTYCVARLGTEIVNGAFQKPAFCKQIQTTSYAMPVATTAAATTMIGIITWEYRKTIKPGLKMLTSASQVEKVMIILVESGFLYILFFLAQVIETIPSVSAAFATRENLGFADLVFAFSTSIIVAWYPTIVIILAHSERTVLDSVVMSTWHVPDQITMLAIPVSQGSSDMPEESLQMSRSTNEDDLKGNKLQ